MIAAWSVKLALKKCKEMETTGAQAILKSQTELEESILSKNIKSSLLIPDSVAGDVCGLFPRRQGSIWKRPGQRRWMQWNAPLSDGQILGVMSDQGRGLLRGCYWGETTRHAVLDIDKGSQYHNAQELGKLLQDFAAIGLALVPYRSSESGGWHLYCYFDSYAPSQEVETTIKDYLRARRYEIRSGTLEVFPSGNALRLPLQPGFGWLDPEGNLELSREELTEGQALGLFCNDIEGSKRNWSEAKTRIDREIELTVEAAGAGVQEHQKAIANQGFEKLFQKGLDWDKWERGRQYWQNGLSKKSQRHDAILCVGHYLWYGDVAAGVLPLPGQRNKAQRVAKIEAWLTEKHNGLSDDLNHGRLIHVSGDINRAASWTRQAPLITKHEPYQLSDGLLKRLKWLYEKTGKVWTVEELAKANIDRSQDARQRIALAVVQLEAEGQILTKAGVARRAKASRNTVAKNSDLLTLCSGEYIAGGAGGSFGAPLSLAGSSQDCSAVDNAACFPVLKEELKGLSCSVGDSGALGGDGPLNFPVAPLVTCLAGSLTDSAQNQAQALRVPSASLTLGPELSVIQAFRHGTAGGILLSWLVCYSAGTKYGTGARTVASSKRRALASFRDGRKEKWTVSDTTNYKFLITAKVGLQSEKEDKLSAAISCPAIVLISESGARRFSSGAVMFQGGSRQSRVDSISVPLLELCRSSKTSNLCLWMLCRQYSSDQCKHLVNRVGRGPPFADRAILLSFQTLILLSVPCAYSCAACRSQY